MKRIIGAHLSTSGGFTKAVERAVTIGASALQLFSTSPRTWRPAVVTDQTAMEFRASVAKASLKKVFFHASYLVNLADTERIGKTSRTALIAELKLQPRMGVCGSVVHLGSFKKETDSLFLEQKYEALIANIKEILAETPAESIFILENVATRKIGQTIDEMARIIDDVASERLTVCLDTCHMHAAGIDLSTSEKYEEFIASFQAKIGLHKISLFHLNDSRDTFGSMRDRHENLGKGFVDSGVFRNLLSDKQLAGIPFILETPGFDKNGPDKENIDIAKSFIT